MEVRSIICYLTCLASLFFISSCGNETYIDENDIYTNRMVLHGMDVFVISSIAGETDETVTINIFEPYENIFNGLLVIPKYSVNRILDVSKDKDCVKMSYTEKEREPAELHLGSGTINVSYKTRYAVRIEAIDENGERFFLDIIPDAFHQNEDGIWV